MTFKRCMLNGMIQLVYGSQLRHRLTIFLEIEQRTDEVRTEEVESSVQKPLRDSSWS